VVGVTVDDVVEEGEKPGVAEKEGVGRESDGVTESDGRWQSGNEKVGAVGLRYGKGQYCIQPGVNWQNGPPV
jgi:hypothetical protein